MSFYTIPPYYSTYAPDVEVVYSTPFAPSIQPFLMPHEPRQIHNMLQVEAARQQYLASVQEQRLLAEQIRQREALQRQAEYLQWEALHHRNLARRNNFDHLHSRRQAFRPRRHACFAVRDEPSVEDSLGFGLSELLGLHNDANTLARVGTNEARFRQAAPYGVRRTTAEEALAEEAKNAALEHARAVIVGQARDSLAAAAEKAKTVAALKARKVPEKACLRGREVRNTRAPIKQLGSLCDDPKQNAMPSLEHLYKTMTEFAKAEFAKVVNNPSVFDSTRDLAPTSSFPAETPNTDISDSKYVSRDYAARTIQRRWRSRSADKAAFKSALATITILRDRFEFLKRNFHRPEHLEFRADDSLSQTALPAPLGFSDQLLYTPSNVTVHTYTNELTKLLTLADGVPSGGNKKIREVRKSFVKMVEDALEEVEKMVADVWERQSSKESSRPSSPEADQDETETVRGNAPQSSEGQTAETTKTTPVTIDVATSLRPVDSVIEPSSNDVFVSSEVATENPPIQTVDEASSSESVAMSIAEAETIKEDSALHISTPPEPATSAEVPVVGELEDIRDVSMKGEEDGEPELEATLGDEVTRQEEISSPWVDVEVDIETRLVDPESSQDIPAAPAENPTSLESKPIAYSSDSPSHTFDEDELVNTPLRVSESQRTRGPASPVSEEEEYNIVDPDY